MNLVTNAQRDPTRTAGLRAEYAKAVKRRFVKLRRLILETVVENDALALEGSGQRSALSFQHGKKIAGVGNAAATRYDFPSDPAGKAQAFMDWLWQSVDEEILEVEQREGRRITLRNEWQSVYVRASYNRSVERADKILRRAGVPVPEYELWQVFRQPIHADALGILYVRNFDTLKGITEAMGSQIAQALAEGMAKGLGMKAMGKLLASKVDGVGIYRGELMARTEIVRASYEASLNRYEEMGIDGIEIEVEIMNANDPRVCSKCASLGGKVFTIQEARGLVPVHPRCRCSALPSVKR